MNWPFHIARHLSAKEQKSFSKSIVRLAITSVALSSTVMIVALATVSGFKNGIKEKIIGLNGHIIVSDAANVEGSIPVGIDNKFEHLKLDIKSIKGVAQVHNCFLKPCIAKGEDEIEGLVAKGVDKDYDFSFYKRHLTKGITPNFSKDTNVCLISEYTASRLALKTGDRLRTIFIREDSGGDQRARAIAPIICGIYTTGLEEFDKNLIVTYRGLVKKMATGNNSFTQFEILLNDFEQADAIRQTISSKLPAGKFSVQTAKTYNRQIFDWLGLLDTNVYIILFLMILVACINMSTTLLILVTERTQMIGMLKSLGANSVDIAKIFIYQSAVIGLIGLGIGNAIGLSLCYLQYKFQFIKLNVETYYVDHVLIDLEGWIIPVVDIGTLLISVFVLMLPALIIGRLTPVKAMRFQ